MSQPLLMVPPVHQLLAIIRPPVLPLLILFPLFPLLPLLPLFPIPWVWQYFITAEQDGGIFKNICQANQGFVDTVVNPDIREAPVVVICNKGIAVNKTGSTKSMA